MTTQRLTGSLYEVMIKPRRVFILDDTSRGEVTLVDTGDKEVAANLVAALREEFGGVDRIYLTHAGSDHYGGLDHMVRAFDPDVYAPTDEADLLDAVSHEPDVLFEHGDILPGNVEVIQIPGHSRAPSALLVRDEDTLISGDILDGADRRGLPEGYLIPPPEMYNHDHAAAEKGLERLLDYEFSSVVVFHGSHVHRNAKIKLDRYVNFKEHFR